MKYDLVSGFETHVELATATKIFCGCSTKFGALPNTHCCPVCTGQPGALPVLNKKVVEFAIRAGLATHCKINTTTHLDRKNYCYPDLPKAYQISQFDKPLCEHGYVELESGKKIRLTRIHIEEDAGKLVHERGFTYIDYNRGGVPLIEIVSEPDISSVEEAREYVEKLQLIMRHIGVSDCKMQEGSMRCDVNISVHREGEPFGTRTEIKNMNSLSFMEKALSYEYSRQCDLLESGEKVVQETRRYNEGAQTTESMRSKEDAQDYRYFPEPDIPAIHISEEFVDSIRKTMPVLPDELRKIFVEKGLSDIEAKRLVEYKRVADFFLSSLSAGDAKIAANLILGEIFRSMGTEEEKEAFELKFDVEAFTELVALRAQNKINAAIQKRVLQEMLSKGGKPSDYLTADDLAGVDDSAVEGLCRDAIAANERAVRDYLGGKEQALKALLGFVMKATRGKANSGAVELKLKGTPASSMISSLRVSICCCKLSPKDCIPFISIANPVTSIEARTSHSGSSIS